jgi:hypothetical protein
MNSKEKNNFEMSYSKNQTANIDLETYKALQSVLKYGLGSVKVPATPKNCYE